jgi:hypothetical protein
VAGQCGGIEPLFEVVFSFLFRKTDYFHIMKPGDKIGFREGHAEQLLLRSFKRFEGMASQIAKRNERQRAPPPVAAPEPAKAKPADAPKTSAGTQASSPPTSGGKGKGKGGGSRIVEITDQAPDASASASAPIEDAADESAPLLDKGAAMAKAAGAKSASHLQEQVGVPYNGGRSAKYHWEQTLHDVTIHAPVPSGTRARDVVCVISRAHLSLKLKGASDPIIDADYPVDARNGQEVWEKVKAAESYWNVGEAKGQLCVSVYLEKERESWWKSAVHGDEEIDTTKVDSTRDMYDYDPETQGAIRKIMFDQHQKRMGKPSSDDLKNEDMLRKAWDAEGSPFKGQPFDPSKLNMGGGGGGDGGAGGLGGLVPPPPEGE